MNPPNETAYIHQQLGEMNATLKWMAAAMQRDRDESKDHREKLSEKLDGMDSRIEYMDDRLLAIEKISKANATELNDEVMPTVRKINIWEQRGVGFLAFAGFAGTSIGAALMKYGEEIRTFFSNFFK